MSTLGFGVWGKLQLVINDIDVTFFRGAPTQIESWSSGDPFDDAAAVLKFESVTPYELPSAGDLFWLQPHASVEINLIRPDDSVYPLWEGGVVSIDDDLSDSASTLTVECLGALYQLDYYIKAPENRSLDNLRLYEVAIMAEFDDKPALRLQPCQIEYPEGLTAEEGTGWKTRYSPAWDQVLTGYIQTLLGDMAHSSLDPGPRSGQWTLMKKPGRIPILKLRDEKTVHYTVLTGVPGVAHSLKSDYSQTMNIVFGEASDESGTTWRNSEVVVDTAFDPPEVTTKYHPLAWDETVHPADKKESEAGEPTDPVPDSFSENYIRVEGVQQFGGNVSLKDGRRTANQQLYRNISPGHFGTITLKVDPPEGSRFEIKAGQNILLRHYKGSGPPIGKIFEELMARGIFLNDDRHDAIGRGQFCTVLVKTLEDVGIVLPTGSTGFPDIAGTVHQSNIEKLEAAGVALGRSDGTFAPSDDLTRGEMAALMVRAVEWATGESLPLRYNYFSDIEGTGHEDEINKAAESFLVVGKVNLAFDPGASATRLQAAIVLQRTNRILGGDMLEDEEGVIFHVSQVQVDFESATTTLTVDSKFRDLMSLAQIIERNKSIRKNPAQMLIANRESGIVDDTRIPWDYNAGSGSLPKKSLSALRREPMPIMPEEDEDFSDYFVEVKAGEWTVEPLVVSSRGSVQRSEVRAYDENGEPLAIPFHVGIYAEYMSPAVIGQIDPFAEDAFMTTDESGQIYSGYDNSAIILWGQHGQRAGYSPGNESETNPPTGVFLDWAPWQFQIIKPWEEEHYYDDPVVWIALYAEEDAWFQGRFYHGVQ